MLKLSLNIFLFFLMSSGSTAKSFTSADSATLNSIRTNFYKAVSSEEITDTLKKFIEQKYSENYENFCPVILAYYGGIEALKAKHAFNPIAKLDYLISALNKLKKAVNENPDNLEIRFLRFSVLHNLPAILGYNDELISDKNETYKLLLQKNYSKLNLNLQKGIVKFLLESGRLSEKQQETLQQLYETMN